jgi:hypothetical protein
VSIKATIRTFAPTPLYSAASRIYRSVVPQRKSTETDSVSSNELHVRRASRLVEMRDSRVLVVGANTGEDCLRFLDLGAAEAHGIDVMDEIGANAHWATQAYFHKASIEDSGLPSD